MPELIKIDDVTEEDWSQVNEENRKIVEEYIRESTQLSPQTLKQYTSALRIYFNWIRENADNKPFYEIKPKNYLMWLLLKLIIKANIHIVIVPKVLTSDILLKRLCAMIFTLKRPRHSTCQ